MKIRKALLGLQGVYDGATAVPGTRVYAPGNRPPGLVLPGDYGYQTWTFDPAVGGTAGSIPAPGTLNLARLYTDISLSITKVSLFVTAGGATLTNVGVGLWNTGVAGAIIGSSVNANGATTALFQSAGEKQVTFGGTLVIPAGGCYIGWWTTGTTQPTFMRGSTLGGINSGLANANARFGTSSTGLTTTAPTTLGAVSAASVAWWGAVT